MVCHDAQVLSEDWLTGEQLGELRALGARRRLLAGSFLFLEGDESGDVFVIDTGMIKVSTTSTDGREVVLAVLDADDVLGELAAVDGSSRSASATALTDVELRSVPSAEFHAFLRDRPDLSLAFASLLAARLRQANRRQLEYAGTDALGRLCGRLEELRTRQGVAPTTPCVIDLPLTQTALAQWAGLSREAVVKGLRTLRTLGWIETTRSSVTIHEPDLLRDRAVL